MSDDLSNPVQPPEEPIGVAVEGVTKSPKQGLVSTGPGRMIVIAVLVSVLAIIAVSCGVAVYVAWGRFTGATGGSVAKLTDGSRVVKNGPAESKTSQKPSDPAAEPPPVANSDVFTLRDPFRPLIRPASETSTTETSGTAGSGETSGSAEGTTSAGPGTLILQDIVMDDGEQKAVLQYEDKTYTLAAGEAIPDTPWAVLSVRDRSVTMLYGDSQIVLTVGQGMQHDTDGGTSAVIQK